MAKPKPGGNHRFLVNQVDIYRALDIMLVEWLTRTFTTEVGNGSSFSWSRTRDPTTRGRLGWGFARKVGTPFLGPLYSRECGPSYHLSRHRLHLCTLMFPSLPALPISCPWLPHSFGVLDFPLSLPDTCPANFHIYSTLSDSLVIAKLAWGSFPSASFPAVETLKLPVEGT